MVRSMYCTYMDASGNPAVKKPDSALREIYTIAIVGVVFLLIALTFYTHSDGAGRSAVMFIIIAVGVAYTITFHEHHMVCFSAADAASASTPPTAPVWVPTTSPPLSILPRPQPIIIAPTGPPSEPIKPSEPITPSGPAPIAPSAPVIPTPVPTLMMIVPPSDKILASNIAAVDKSLKAEMSTYYGNLRTLAQANRNINIPVNTADTTTQEWHSIVAQLNSIDYNHDIVRNNIYIHTAGPCRAYFDQYINIPYTQWRKAVSTTHAYLGSVEPSLGTPATDFTTEWCILNAVYFRRFAAGIPDAVYKYVAKKMHKHMFRLSVFYQVLPNMHASDFITSEYTALKTYIKKLHRVQAASATKITDILSHMCGYFTPRQIQYRVVACRPTNQLPLPPDIVKYLEDHVSADDAKFADMREIIPPPLYNSTGGTKSNPKLYRRYKREFAKAGSDDNKASVRLRYGLEVRPKNATAETNYTKFAQLLVGCTKENNTNANAIKDMLGCAVAAFSRPVVEMQLKAEIKRHSKKGRAVIDWTAYLAGGEFALPIPAP